MSHFADNLNRLMGFHDLTNEKLSELVGVSRTTVSNWRTGTKEPNLSSLVKIVEVFGINPVRMAKLSMDELLEDVADYGRFIETEGRVHAGSLGEVVPLKRAE